MGHTSNGAKTATQAPRVYRIAIAHYLDKQFLDAFRSDVAAANEHVLILSPFMAPGRALHYYPVFQVLRIRDVPIDVYARPRSGQPESLRGTFSQVERGLRLAGVRLHLRPGMHEKVGVVDGKVLWHGSLNVLSHNDTRESMLRFESVDLAREVLADSGIEFGAGRQPQGSRTAPLARLPETTDSSSTTASTSARDGTATVADTPACPSCGRLMHFFENAALWICPGSPSCSGTLPSAPFNSQPTAPVESQGEQPESSRTALECPLCGTPMEVKRGVSVRISCPSPGCGFALEPRLAAGILRVLKRRKPR